MTIIKPQFVTFTGIDAKTDLHRVKELSNRYPIEWGVLFGGSLQNGQRYPDILVAEDVIKLAEQNVRFSAHLCGAYAKRILHHVVVDEDMLFFKQFGRIQVNASTYLIPALLRLKDAMQRPIIMQTRNDEWPGMVETVSGHSASEMGLYCLHDTSGGKGKVPSSRPVQKPGTPLVGYAGGFGPDNVASILATIEADNFWIDMESNVRTDDWLDLDKCEAVCQAIWPEA